MCAAVASPVAPISLAGPVHSAPRCPVVLLLCACRQYDAAGKLLSRTVSFRPPAPPPSAADVTPSSTTAASPSPDTSPAASLTSLFRFVSSVGVLSVNLGHSPYQLTVTPRRLQVLVELRTVALHGLSYADFQLATHIDGLEAASKRQSAAARASSGSDT